MRATFVELPAFSRHRAQYLDDEGFRALQNALMKHPEAGDVIVGTGGLRKLRQADARRGKGKRGGLRVIQGLSSKSSRRAHPQDRAVCGVAKHSQ
ncbi:addiction module toxin RelE [Vandammella animalimorsus]|uniref:addiction module toxin RelE n=1 Tax=Vandammella animalimorsus TaxID=2029117 RepID=UPI001EEF14B6|nr:addiction module toxin RelE [Vandammella animalimorsus]